MGGPHAAGDSTAEEGPLGESIVARAQIDAARDPGGRLTVGVIATWLSDGADRVRGVRVWAQEMTTGTTPVTSR